MHPEVFEKTPRAIDYAPAGPIQIEVGFGGNCSICKVLDNPVIGGCWN